MAISGREKLSIGRDIETKLTSLKTATTREKLGLGREIDALLAKLRGDGITAIAETLFQQITNKAFDSLGAVEVFSKIKSEVDRITREIIGGDNAIDKQLLDACIKCADLAEQAGIA